MDKSEPTLVPQWLKSSGSTTGGVSANNHFSSSSLSQDDHAKLKPARNNSSVNRCDHDSGRSSFSDRTSSYFQRSSSSNGSGNLRSFGSFGRTTRDRDWDKEVYEYHGKEKSILRDNRHKNYSDPLESIFPSRLERDGIRRTQSSISGKNGEPGSRTVSVQSSNVSKNSHKNGNSRMACSSPISSVHKAAFDRDFPSLGVEERRADLGIRRVPSPGLSTAIQSLPIGSSALIDDGGWISALAEVPVMVVGHGTSSPSAPQAVLPSSASVISIVTTGFNMAETLAQGSPRAQATSQLSVETQRLEELAIKQSRQLIPVTPCMPKALALNSSDKPKPKVGQQQHQPSSIHLANHSPRGAPTKSDISKTSSLGKLLVLKPAQDRNGISYATKDSLSPKIGSKVTNNPLIVAPQTVTSVPLRTKVTSPHLVSAEHKTAAAVVPSALEKRPTSQAKSRNDFFNLVRKKSMRNSSSMLSDPATGETEAAALIPQGRDSPPLDRSGYDHLRKDSGVLVCNAKCSSDGHRKSLDSGDNHSMSDVIPYSEEEEAAFLRSLGWDESTGEDEGLTEEEINAFYSGLIKT